MNALAGPAVPDAGGTDACRCAVPDDVWQPGWWQAALDLHWHDDVLGHARFFVAGAVRSHSVTADAQADLELVVAELCSVLLRCSRSSLRITLRGLSGLSDSASQVLVVLVQAATSGADRLVMADVGLQVVQGLTSAWGSGTCEHGRSLWALVPAPQMASS